MKINEGVPFIISGIDTKYPVFTGWDDCPNNDGHGVLIVSLTDSVQAAPGLPAYLCSIAVSGMTFTSEDPDKVILQDLFSAANAGILTLHNITPLTDVWSSADDIQTFTINFKIAIEE